MPLVNLKVSLGTVNYTDFIHVTAAKVSNPTIVVWENWFDAPLVNFNFIIPGLDPENYYIRYYDSPDNVSLGTLVAEILVNALTGEWLYERRFYTCDGPNVGDPAADTHIISDPYFADKNVTGVFKEGFRYLKPTDEFTFDGTNAIIDVVTGINFSTGEVICVEIKYNVANNGSGTTLSGLYTGTMTITEQTKTLLGADADKRVRLKGTAATQIITLPSLAVLSLDKGFYFDHSVKKFQGGCPVQTKLLCAGSDKIQFNGFCNMRGITTNQFTEFWVSNGEHLLLRKAHDDQDSTDYWEVIGDYQGVHVGEKCALGYRDHPGIIAWDGALYDGDEYPRIWWWLKNILPSTHKYISDQVIAGTHFETSRAGMFALHSTLKKFRAPMTFKMGEMSLSNYGGFADDPDRTVNYPGGFQSDRVGPHPHPFHRGRGGGINPADPNGGAVTANNNNPITEDGWVLNNTGTTFTVHKNTGVVYATRI